MQQGQPFFFCAEVGIYASRANFTGTQKHIETSLKAHFLFCSAVLEMSITYSTNTISISDVDAATSGNGVQHYARSTGVTAELHGGALLEHISAF